MTESILEDLLAQGRKRLATAPVGSDHEKAIRETLDAVVSPLTDGELAQALTAIVELSKAAHREDPAVSGQTHGADDARSRLIASSNADSQRPQN